jgi:hypothetical protein
MFSVFKKLRTILSLSLVIIFFLGFGFVRLFASSDFQPNVKRHHVAATRLLLIGKTERDCNETQNELRDNISLVGLPSSDLLSSTTYSQLYARQCLIQPVNYIQVEKLCLQCRYNI